MRSIDGLERLSRQSREILGDAVSVNAYSGKGGEAGSLNAILLLNQDEEVMAEARLIQEDERNAPAIDTKSHSHHDKQMRFSDDSTDDDTNYTKMLYKMCGFNWEPKIFDRNELLGPQMYKLHNIGLYTHYGAVGLIGGIQGLCFNFCFYYYKGNDNVCATSTSIIFIAWGFKIFYAMATDSFRPFGTRRKAYLVVGWIGVLLMTLLLAIIGDSCSVQTWLGLSVITQAFCMLADVPGDGYSVELGQLESDEERGMILSTGQRIRFSFTMLAGLIQALMVNGLKTNKEGCEVAFEACWGWGLTVGQYYGLIFAMLLVLVFPVFFLRELPCKHIPQHTFNEHRLELWETMKNPTTMYLLIFVTGNGALSIMTPTTYAYVQYSLIGLTNFQAGIQTILTYLAVVTGIKLFQMFFIQTNWRNTLYLSVGLASTLGLMWILVYYDLGGLMNSWFTIFITLNQALAQGISQVLFSMAVIELAKRGQEAITYELIISVANSASNAGTILAAQLLTPMNAVICSQSPNDDSGSCDASKVNTYDTQTFKDSHGPEKFRNYSFLVLGISIISLIIFTNFLPRQKFECAAWKMLGDTGKFWLPPTAVGVISSLIATIIISYQIACAIALLNPATSCLPAFGGDGC